MGKPAMSVSGDKERLSQMLGEGGCGEISMLARGVRCRACTLNRAHVQSGWLARSISLCGD